MIAALAPAPPPVGGFRQRWAGSHLAVVEDEHVGAPACECLHVRSRGLPYLFATGYGAKILASTHLDVPVLQKPFGPVELRRALMELSAHPDD